MLVRNVLCFALCALLHLPVYTDAYAVCRHRFAWVSCRPTHVLLLLGVLPVTVLLPCSIAQAQLDVAVLLSMHALWSTTTNPQCLQQGVGTLFGPAPGTGPVPPTHTA